MRCVSSAVSIDPPPADCHKKHKNNSLEPRREHEMPDLIKKTLLAGVGLALKTWDEVEDLAKELVDKGKMTEKDGSKFLNDLQKRYEETQKKLETRVEKTVQDFLKKANVVTSDELKAVKKEVRELKKMISSEKEKS
jgi:polyhydroxyalkanoate synthesis regulator phasin